MSINEPNYWINLLPKHGRSLEKVWNSKENYQEQLLLDINSLVELWVDLYNLNWEVSILDIWWNNSTAISDLKEILIKKWVPEKKIKLNKVDLEKSNEVWVNYISWDLNYDDFLLELVEKLWIQSQWIIFCNQVSQYLNDRLKVIKFVCDFLLKKWWKFYCNMLLSSFFSGSWVPLSVLEESLNEIMTKESSRIDVKIKANLNLSGFRMYEFTKTEENWELEVPKYARIFEKREIDGFKIVAYNFRDRTDLEKLREIIKNKWLVKQIINPEN